MDDDEVMSPGLEAIPGHSGMILRRAEPAISRFNDMALMKQEDDVTSILDQYLDDITNKLLPLEESDLMVKSLERQADHKKTRTYFNGEPLQMKNPTAPTLVVGLTFVPGADRAQVARIEIDDLVGEPPNQKSSIWRVNTAGTLLKNFEVDDDLYVNQKDRTSAIYTSAKEKAEKAAKEHRRIRKSEAKHSGKDVIIYSSGGKENMVNIDSDHVHLVKDLRVKEWDLQSTLIEVDGKSLVALMLEFRHLIKQTTAADASATSFAEMASILERMIENARRLCMKSPILFRMSTRSLIKNSKDIRYGVNQDHMFQTLSTSRGIRETIRNSAAYWLALSGLTSNLKKDRKEQEKKLDFIRTRYLQMLVLLLSFLNNGDLNDLKEFLEATYNMKADRKHVEMLILKVIPLQSINPKVFMKQLIATVEEDSFLLPETGSMSQIWDTFVQRILADGYLLPGNTVSLGRKENSWIVRWPEGKRNGESIGFSSSEVFDNMQYFASNHPLLNQVPPFELHPESSYNELTVIMKNNIHYKIDPAELEKISAMVPGTYAIWEAKEGGRHCDLEILQYEVNTDLWRAISLSNALIHKVNVRLAAPRRRIMDVVKFRQPEVRFLAGLKGCGKLTRHEAKIGQDTLAIVYKKEGRMITRKEAVRNMNGDLQKLERLIRYADMEVSGLDAKKPYGMDDRNLIQELQELKTFVHYGKQGKIHTADTTDDLGDDPISQVMYPPNLGVGQHNIWFDYRASKNRMQPYLEVWARVDLVTCAVWDGDDMFTVDLNGGLKMVVSPLIEVPEGYVKEEIKAGDTVALIGQYIAVASPAPPAPVAYDPAYRYNNQAANIYFLDNYLKIVGVEEQSEGGRRGRNRAEEERPSTLILFR